MKSKYLLLGALALTLGACSNDDDPAAGKVAADIVAEIDNVKSRASGTVWAQGDKIGITTSGDVKTSYTNMPYIFDGTRFTAEGAGIFFQSAETVTFSAYYPYYAEGGRMAVDTKAENQTADRQPGIDLMYTSGARADKANPTVLFTGDNAFRHMMSQITLRLTEGDDIDFAGELTSYSLLGLKMEGEFDTATGSVAVAPDATAKELTINLTDAAATEKVYTTAPVILIPQNASGVSLTVTVDGERYKAALPLTTLEGGNNYILPVTVKKNGLSVGSAEIADWNSIETESSEAVM